MIFKLNQNYLQTYSVTEKVYKQFIETFKDNNPLHTNDTFAESKGFQGKVMHGNILNGFLSHFIGECLPTKDVIIHLQEIQFKNPVYLGDTLEFNAQVFDISESVNIVVFKFSFKNANSKIVAKGKIQIGII